MSAQFVYVQFHSRDQELLNELGSSFKMVVIVMILGLTTKGIGQSQRSLRDGWSHFNSHIDLTQPAPAADPQ